MDKTGSAALAIIIILIIVIVIAVVLVMFFLHSEATANPFAPREEAEFTFTPPDTAGVFEIPQT